MTINLLRDDGGVVYLNTNEVFRSDMPNGTILYGTYASGAIPGGDETVFIPKSTSVTNLVAGTNICAVEIHNANATSSDISFDLELLGLLKATPPTLYLNRFSNQLVLFWNDSTFQLEQADDVTGPWSRTGAGESPISVNTTGAARFYRLAKP